MFVRVVALCYQHAVLMECHNSHKHSLSHGYSVDRTFVYLHLFLHTPLIFLYILFLSTLLSPAIETL